jgi:hypothetical protein
MDIFDLNSDSYNDEEIETLLKLNSNYNLKDIMKAKEDLIAQLSKKQNVTNEEQRGLHFFIDTIANRIQNKLNVKLTTPNHSIIQQGSNFIIENPDTIIGKKAKIEEGRVTIDSGKVPPGYINPINVRTITQSISIDSRFRPNYYATKSTNFTVTLPAIQKNVVSMRVAAIELPTTYYAVSRSNENSTCLIIDLSNNTDAWILTLPDGNYEPVWSNNSHAADIELGMNNAIVNAQQCTVNSAGKIGPAAGGPKTLSAADLTFRVDRISGKSVFSGTTAGKFTTAGFTLRFNVNPEGNLSMETNLQMRLGWQLGFRAAEYVAANKESVSEGICLISGPRYGFISINDYQKNTGPSYIVAYANSILQDNIITRINLAELQADFGVYQSSSNPGLTIQLNRTREYFGPVDIQRLQIALYDEYGRIIDLNNMDWSLTLAFELLYN